MTDQSLRQKIADTLPLPLRIWAKTLAEGQMAGAHRSTTKGSGIEFAGHRPYTPGDDLRHLDRHAQLRHNRLLVRQFQTDTERSVHIICDISQSMHYADPEQRGSSKLDRALLLSASLAYCASKAGDRLGFTLVSERTCDQLPVRPGGAGIQQLISVLEDQQLAALQQLSPLLDRQSGHLTETFWSRSVSRLTREAPETKGEPQTLAATQKLWSQLLHHLGATLHRGSVIYIISDFLDLSPEMSQQISQLTSRNRTVRAAQVLTPSELNFPFEGALQFLDPETGAMVQAEAKNAQAIYLAALEKLTASLEHELKQTGSLLVRVTTEAPPELALSALASGQTSRGALPWV